MAKAAPWDTPLIKNSLSTLAPDRYLPAGPIK